MARGGIYCACTCLVSKSHNQLINKPQKCFLRKVIQDNLSSDALLSDSLSNSQKPFVEWQRVHF